MTLHVSSYFARLQTVVIGCVAALLVACAGSSDETAPPPGPPAPPISVLPTCTAQVSANAPLKDISTVQGTGSISPWLSQTVTVRGVVVGEFQNQTPNQTVTQLNGFFIQQTLPDGDPLTSEGIFVFAPGAAKVSKGDYLQVSGVVGEFSSTTVSGTATVSDSITQIGGTVTLSVCGTGVAVTPTQISLPWASATDLERYEGMLVEFTQTLAVTESFEAGRFGQFVLSLGGRQFHPNNGNAAVTSDKNKLERIVLDDGSSAQNPNPTPYFSAPGAAGTRRIGDTVQKLTGVLSHNNGAYRIHPTIAPNFVAASARPAAPPALPGTLKVASFNVLNYFTTLGQRGANTAGEFTRQRSKIIEAIAGLDADVLGLMEIENNNDVATNDLVAGLNAKLGAGTYAAVNSGTFGTDQIKVDMLYKPAKVTRVGGLVLPTGTDLANYTAASGRPPLAQRFASAANNGSFWFVVNHFKSKGSCPISGDVELGQGCWNSARTVQASALNNFITTLKAKGESDVLMMGDFNSYLLEDPPKALEAAGFESLLKRVSAAERYTYVFSGETGALDHAYASDTLKAQVTGVGVWHINADEPPVLDYNTEFKTDDRYAPTAYRASDHDPVMVALTLTADSLVSLPVLNATLPAAAQVGRPTNVVVTDALPGASATVSSLSIDWGDATAPSALAGPGSATHTYSAVGSYTVVVTLVSSGGQSASKSAVVTVGPAPLAVPDVFFSEYVEGSSNNKAIEIYNPTATGIDLSAYSVRLYANGATTASNLLQLTGSLPAGGALVIVNNGAGAAFKVAGSITSSVANFNGNDALTLEKSGSVMDRIGQLGNDPGSAWTGGTLSTLDRTLRRKPSIKIGDNNAAGVFDPSLQWDGFPIDTADGLGAHSVSP